MLTYGERTSINMVLSGKTSQVYSSDNPIIGVIKVNVSDWVLKASAIKVVLLRKDLGHKIAPKKDMFGNVQEGKNIQYHFHNTKEICSTTIAEFEDMLIHTGQYQYQFKLKIPKNVEENFSFEDDGLYCKTMYQVKAYFLLTDREILTDETRIKDSPWSVMKEFAMKKRYKSSSWYKSSTDEEKRLVELLRKA